jgi:tRNA-Thr(GGU) m(6)t(6)A37 methyltransferase TsaA
VITAESLSQQRCELRPVGRIARCGNEIRVEILEPFRPAMQLLDRFTHLIVVWWADKHDDEKSRAALQCEPPYAPGRLHCVFATRAEYRPNPIAITTCKMIAIDEQAGVIQIADIDALDGTPGLDLKPYYPVCDRVQEARIPEWLSDWPDWMPEEGLGLELGRPPANPRSRRQAGPRHRCRTASSPGEGR